MAKRSKQLLLQQPKQFAADLLAYLAQPDVKASLAEEKAAAATTNGTKTDKVKVVQPLIGAEHTRNALKALRNVLKTNAGVEVLCIGHFRVLFDYLAAVDCPPAVRALVLEIVSLAAANQECVGDMAASGCVVPLLRLMRHGRTHLPIILPTLLTLASSPRCVKDALDAGGLVYLLAVFADDSAHELRCAAAEVIGKMQSEKLTGPRWHRAIVQYVPAIFADACRDSARTAVNLFDTNTENPELIWNDDARDMAKAGLRAELDRIDEKMSEKGTAPAVAWKPPAAPIYASTQGGSDQLIIGGVYVKVFVQQPQWTLRSPRHFLTELVHCVMR